MKPKITLAWESLGISGGTRNDASKWTEDRSTLWVTLWSDRLKRVRSGVYRYPLCEEKDLEGTSGARHHANVKEAITRGAPMKGFLVWPKKELNAAGQHGIQDADAKRQYEVEIESSEGAVVVALAKGM
jgi:hypothetical protein